MRKMIDVECKACGREYLDVYIDLDVQGPIDGEPRGNTCECGDTLTRLHNRPGNAAPVHGDDIPGGLLIKHGICNPDGSPKRYYSKTEIQKAARAAGLTWGAVEHVPDRGSDKNKHTTRWT